MCSVLKCDSWRRRAPKFILPEDPEKRLEWVQFLFVVNGQRIKESSWTDIRVCSEHFTRSCFVTVAGTVQLKLDATPSVYAPTEPKQCSTAVLLVEKQPNVTGKLPILRLAPAQKTRRGRQRKTYAEKQSKKKESDRARNKTRINIGAAYERWRDLRVQKGFKSDAECARFLLDKYQSAAVATTSKPTKCQMTTHSTPAVSSIIGDSSSGRSDIAPDIKACEEIIFQHKSKCSRIYLCRSTLLKKQIYFTRGAPIDWHRFP